MRSTLATAVVALLVLLATITATVATNPSTADNGLGPVTRHGASEGAR